MPPHHTVIVCATPRTGSTLLCARLAPSGVGGSPESCYRAKDCAGHARTRRRDAVAQAVSRLKAEDSQVWHLDRTKATRACIPTHDATRLDAFIAATATATGKALRGTWFAVNGLTSVALWSKDLVAQVRRAMTAMGLTPPPVPLSVPNRHMADAQSAGGPRPYRQGRVL